MAALDRIIDELASRQHGSLGLNQLRLAGATRASIRHQLDAGRLLIGPNPRTFRHAAYALTWRGRLWAAQLWAGDGCVLSHESAGALYELDGCPPDRVVVTVPKGSRNRHPSVRLHATTRPITGWRLMGGLLVASMEATLVDLAAVLREADADDALHSALRRRLTTVERIEHLLDGRPGSAALSRLLADRIGTRPRDSRFEGRFIRLARAHGLELVPQYSVVCDGEPYYIDFAEPRLLLAIEVDGFSVHGTPKAFQHDLRRQTLLQLAGWRILRFTWDDVRERPDWVLACVRRALAA